MNSTADKNLIFRDFKRTFPTILKGEGIYLFDETGKKYLDGTSGSAAVCNLGHSVTEISRAVAEEMDRYAYCPCHCFANRPSVELAALLADIAPGRLNRAWTVSDGSEATEAAVKLARQYQVLKGNPSKSKVITRWQSYHGATLMALGYGGLSGRRRIYSPFFCNVHHIPPAYCYRCPFNHTYPGCDVLCARALETEIRQLGPENVAVFIAEPIVGSALGCAPPPDEYFGIIRKLCDEYDVVFVADEVMTGFGRIGHWFGIDHWSVVPDIIACAKGISGGYLPLGAIIVDERIVGAMIDADSNIISGHTNSAHHVTAAAGVAAIKYIQVHDLVQRAREMGAYFEAGMQSLADLPLVGDVRGRGLFMGFELVRDKNTKEPFAPAARMAHRVEAAALERGLITYPGTGCVDGDRGDHILMAPPLIIRRSEIDELVGILAAAIRTVTKELE